MGLRLRLLAGIAGLLLALSVLGRLLGLVLGQLGLLCRHDAIVVFRVLEIILGHHSVAAGIGVAGELEIFLIDMRRRAADFDFRSRGIEGAVGIVSTTAAVAAAITAAAIAVLRPATAST